MKKALKYLLFYIALPLFLILIIDDTIANYFISSIWNNCDFSSVLFKFTFVLVFLLPTILIEKKYVSNLNMHILIVPVIIYTFYRYDLIKHSRWVFVHFIDGVYYVDVLYLICIVLVCKCLYINKDKLKRYFLKNIENQCDKKESTEDDNIVLEDIPISTMLQDKLGYYKSAENLVKHLLDKIEVNNKFETIIVGIVGEWGSGKTSFLNMMNLHFKDKNVEIIKINAWQYSSTEQLTKNLFMKIYEKVAPGNFEFKKKLLRYAEALSETRVGPFSKLFLLNNKYSIDEQYKRINDKINNHDKKIIIEIDDIDRLMESEIIDIFKLLRNTSNFNNVIYIITYSKEYIINTIAKNIYKPEIYIEKIVDIPYPLPISESQRKEHLYQMLIEKLLQTIMKYNDKDFSKVIGDLKSDVETISKNIYKFIGIRSIKKVAQLVLTNQDILTKLRLELPDYFVLCYIENRYPLLYSELSSIAEKTTNEDDIISMDYNKVVINYRKEVFGDIINKGKDNNTFTAEEYVNERLVPKFGGKDSENIFQLLRILFSEEKKRIILSIVSPIFYKYYFLKSIPPNLAIHSEFMTSMADIKVLKSQLEKEEIASSKKSRKSAKCFLSKSVSNNHVTNRESIKAMDNLESLKSQLEKEWSNYENLAAYIETYPIEEINNQKTFNNLLDVILECLYPEQFIYNKYSLRSEHKITPILGRYILDNNSNENKNRQKFIDYIFSYTNNNTYDNLFSKRFVLLCALGNDKRIYADNEYFEIVKKYTDTYLEETDTYDNFNIDFWDIIGSFRYKAHM